MMRSRTTTLRLRLVIGFLLVSVPAMLGSAYFAAALISNAFEANVEKWLGETSSFFKLDVQEATLEAQRVAQVISQRLKTVTAEDFNAGTLLDKDLSILNSVGYDLIAVYNDENNTIYKSRDFRYEGLMPHDNQQGIFQIESDGHHYLMAGAFHIETFRGKRTQIFVGKWLDDIYLGGIKVVTSLEVQIFAKFDRDYRPILQNNPVTPGKIMVTPAILDRLSNDDTPIFDNQSDEEGVRKVYTGLRGVDGSIVAFAVIGLRGGEDFFAQIGQWRLFIVIFLLGSGVAIVAGLFTSGILVRPLRALIKGVRSITMGDYNQRVTAEGGRELAELAGGFNKMAEQLGKMKAMEVELRRRDRLATLGQAASVIAHEVRNPLGIIKTSTEVVRNRAKLGPSEDRMLGYVIDEVRRIETLVRDFLDFAQPKEPSRAIFPLRSVVDRVASFAAPEFAKHAITFEIVDEPQGVAISGDPDQLHQACLNLVLNAIDAMPAGGKITIKLAATANQATLTIADSGTGMPAEIVADIFNPFFTTKAKGTGLGLAKVQSVVNAHGGTVSCVSDVGKGAAFILTLPRADAGKKP